jgi:hypothetical protein
MIEITEKPIDAHTAGSFDRSLLVSVKVRMGGCLTCADTDAILAPSQAPLRLG